MQLKDLAANPKNPRVMESEALESLEGSLTKYGDLSGFVFNRRSGNLISGHQRQKVVPPDCPIIIEKTYDEPTACFTVAEGHVLINGERFKYREVDADEAWEAEAMIAANKHSGKWEERRLAELMKTPNFDLKLTGFTVPELQMMNIEAPSMPDTSVAGDDPPPSSGGGEEGAERLSMSERFMIPPFSVLNAREGWWQDRKRQWIKMGIKSELGRGSHLHDNSPNAFASAQSRIDKFLNKEQGLGAVPANPEATQESMHYYRKQNSGTLGAVAPNEKDILKREGNYAPPGKSKMAMHNDPMVRKAKYDK